MSHIAIPMSQYPKLLSGLKACSETERRNRMRNLCRTDLYFLLRYVLNRKDIEDPWLFERCREIQAEPNGHLDLWAREHYKSTIITFAKTIQDILASHGDDPLYEREFTIGIFSFNRGIAMDFVSQVRDELTNNKMLKDLFPDVLYENPAKESPSWSTLGGLRVKRKSNPKEETLEGWGLVDSMPTGRHFVLRVYDDVITEKFARSPDMIAKSTESWELSLNLGARGGYSRYIGTRYHYNDTYRVIMQRNAAEPRIYKATQDGQVDGEPVLLTRDELAQKRREMGPYIFACQMMQDPKADETQGFRRGWLRYYQHSDGSGMNIYILVDPASEKKKTSDYTVMSVIGLAQDMNYYLLDMVRDRLNLTERGNTLIRLHRKWRPKGVGYEKYGMQADVEHIKYRQDEENYHFQIIELGGNMPKNDRIKRLIPIFEQSRFYLPPSMHRTLYDGVTVDLIEAFQNDEYDPFPVPVHDDMLDSMSRIMDEDMHTMWPEAADRRERYAGTKKELPRSRWVG